jgi:hypothetical protein
MGPCLRVTEQDTQERPDGEGVRCDSKGFPLAVEMKLASRFGSLLHLRK